MDKQVTLIEIENTMNNVVDTSNGPKTVVAAGLKIKQITNDFTLDFADDALYLIDDSGIKPLD